MSHLHTHPRVKRDLGSWQPRHFPWEPSCSGMFYRYFPSPHFSADTVRTCHDSAQGSVVLSGLAQSISPKANFTRPQKTRAAAATCLCKAGRLLAQEGWARSSCRADRSHLHVHTKLCCPPPPSCSLFWDGSAYSHF